MFYERESVLQNHKKDILEKKVEQYKDLVKKLMNDEELNEEDDDKESQLSEKRKINNKSGMNSIM